MHLVIRGSALVVMAVLAFGGCGDDAATPVAGESPEGNGGALGSSLEFTAVDIAFEEKEASAAAGELEVVLTNDGAIEHSWVVEGYEDELRLYTPQAGAMDEGTLTLEAGAYTYYCDITGHRAAGMEGALTVE